MINRNVTVAALAAAAVLLGAASTAEAGFHVSMSSSAGPIVTTDNPNSGDPTLVTGQLTPEGAVANWDVGALCVTNVLDPLGTCASTRAIPTAMRRIAASEGDSLCAHPRGGFDLHPGRR